MTIKAKELKLVKEFLLNGEYKIKIDFIKEYDDLTDDKIFNIKRLIVNYIEKNLKSLNLVQGDRFIFSNSKQGEYEFSTELIFNKK
jgi:hypothetical protein